MIKRLMVKPERVRARDLLSLETRLNLVYALFMSVFMATVISGVMTWFNVSPEQFGIDRWVRSYSLAWPITFTLVLVVGPIMRRLAMKVVRQFEPSSNQTLAHKPPVNKNLERPAGSGRG